MNDEDAIKITASFITPTFPENFIDPTDSRDFRVDGDRYLDHSVLQTYLNIHNITSIATDYTSLPSLREFTLQSIVDAAGLLESNCPVAKFDYSKSDSQIIFEIPDSINLTLKDLVYRWDFGDGTSKETTAKTIEHIYQQSGNYPVKLKVTNRNYSDFGDEAVFEKIVEYNLSGPCTDELGYYRTNPDGSEGGYVSFSSSVATSAYIHPSVSVCFYSNIEGNTVIDVRGDSAETNGIPMIYSSVIKDSTFIIDREVYEARLMVSNSTIENTSFGSTSSLFVLFSTIKDSTFNGSYAVAFNYSEVFESEIDIIDSNEQKYGIIDILESRVAFFEKTTTSQTIYIHSNNFRAYGEGNVLDEVFYIEPYNP